MSEGSDWAFFRSPGGADVVKREIKDAKLSRTELGRLIELQRRHARDETVAGLDFKKIRGDVWELRLKGDRRQFRLFYAPGEHGLVLLALRFAKKNQRRIPHDIDTACARLAEYRKQLGN